MEKFTCIKCRITHTDYKEHTELETGFPLYISAYGVFILYGLHLKLKVFVSNIQLFSTNTSTR